MRQHWPLVLAAGVLEVIYVLLGFRLSTSTTDIVPFVLLCLGAFGAYAISVRIASRKECPVSFLLLMSLIFRATLVPVEGNPYAPDADTYRYLWDGRVTAEGLNPYRYSPLEIREAGGDATASEDLKRLHELSKRPPFDRLFSEISYPEVKTIYPPGSQGLFAFASRISPGNFVALKIVLFSFEAGTLALLVLILRALGRPSSWMIIYGWCPLAVEEFAYAGHHDAAAVFFLTLMAYFVVRLRPWCAGLALGAAILIKLFPLALLPILARRPGWRTVLSALSITAFGFLPFISAGWNLFSGFATFAERWKFNASVFLLLERAAGLLSDAPGTLARVISAAVVAATSVAFLWRRLPGLEETLRWMLVVLSVLLALSPVLDPWYVTWVVPLLCVFRSRPLLLLTGCVFMHYLYFIDQRSAWWIRVLEFGPVAILLAVEIWIMYARRKNLGDHPGLERGGRDSAGPGRIAPPEGT